MLSDTNSATTYLQTAFRCQTPAKIDGKIKTNGYVFDFAPDRTLRLVAEAIELNHKSSKVNTPEQRQAMQDFLNFCPIIAAEDGSMKPYDVNRMLLQLKKAIIERVSRNGFDDPKLYNDELLKLSNVDLEQFNNLKKIIGTSTGSNLNDLTINNLGMSDLEIDKSEEVERKNKKNVVLSDEEKELLKKRKEALEQKKNAINILRAVSIRMPMLVYGADVAINESLTLNKFVELVDDESWEEFMPAGLTKLAFRNFIKYYDEEVFRGVSHSIRAKAFDCDKLFPTDRILAIAELFKTFKNPDKETVLTPWDVVNMHMTISFGGHDFRSVLAGTRKPIWKSLNVDTSIWSNDDSRILDINSKSGLYPLLATYNIYSRKLIRQKAPEDKVFDRLWKDVLANNIYVLCKSPMAQKISMRTLAGYSGAKTNVIYIKNLIKKLQHKESYQNYNLLQDLNGKFGSKDIRMKFSAVVGNPPYQLQTKDTSDNPVYHLFIQSSYELADKVCLIHPARFLFNAGKTPKSWNEEMLHNCHVKILFYEQQSSKIFPNTDIKGGVTITYYDRNKDFGAIRLFSKYEELNTIITKVKANKEFTGLSKIIFSQNKFNLERLYKDYPNVIREKHHKY